MYFSKFNFPWVRKILRRRKQQPTPAGYTPWGHKELDMTDHMHTHMVPLCLTFAGTVKLLSKAPPTFYTHQQYMKVTIFLHSCPLNFLTMANLVGINKVVNHCSDIYIKQLSWPQKSTLHICG